MDTTTIKKSQPVVLDKDKAPAFEPKGERLSEMAGVIAASFLKFSVRGKLLTEQDTVESFIEMQQLYQTLKSQAVDFIRSQSIPLNTDQPLDELLLCFASYRLTEASRTYYFDAIAKGGNGVKEFVIESQQDLDNMFQSF